MKLKSIPGRIVQKRVKRNGKKKIIQWFRFDENGFAYIDESKISESDMIKLKKTFEIVEDEEEIRNRAKQAGIKSWHVKSIDKLKKELEV